jgi:hypothetical protein
MRLSGPHLLLGWFREFGTSLPHPCLYDTPSIPTCQPLIGLGGHQLGVFPTSVWDLVSWRNSLTPCVYGMGMM